MSNLTFEEAILKGRAKEELLANTLDHIRRTARNLKTPTEFSYFVENRAVETLRLVVDRSVPSPSVRKMNRIHKNTELQKQVESLEAKIKELEQEIKTVRNANEEYKLVNRAMSEQLKKSPK